MIIEDFVMLGRTEPCDSKKYGKTVCSAGYSRELRQFVRLYPISMQLSVPRWSLCRVEVERNRHDSREESWKLKESDSSLRIIGKADRNAELDYLLKREVPSIKHCNDQRSSLAIVRLQDYSYCFGSMKPNEERNMDMFPESINEKRTPRLQFRDRDGPHDLQLLDWGCHEFLRKNGPNEHYKLWNALLLDNPTYEHWLFTGNHSCHRNSWLGISLLSLKCQRQANLFE